MIDHRPHSGKMAKAPKERYRDRALLTDGGVKFLLEVREAERLFSGTR